MSALGAANAVVGAIEDLGICTETGAILDHCSRLPSLSLAVEFLEASYGYDIDPDDVLDLAIMRSGWIRGES